MARSSIVFVWPRRITIVITAVALGLSFLVMHADSTKAAEDARQFYFLGSRGPLAGAVPPPGTYLSSIKYFYSGDASGAAADSVALDQIGNITLQADIKAEVEFLIEVPTVLWVAPRQVLGGNLGLGLLVPVGWVDISVDVDALATLTIGGDGPLSGTTLQRGNQLALSDDTVNFGDPVLQAILGWQSGYWHWNVAGLLNVPIGAYNKDDLANVGFNRWVFDASGAFTWFDPARGHEASVVAGFTFNGENPDTNYRTGTEFHVEFALMQHFSKAFAVGLVGLHYEQLTGDSGAGATLGSFKGRTTAIGPNINYNLQLGQLPVSTQLRWYHELDVKNRLEGDIVFFQTTIPLGGPRQ